MGAADGGVVTSGFGDFRFCTLTRTRLKVIPLVLKGVNSSYMGSISAGQSNNCLSLNPSTSDFCSCSNRSPGWINSLCVEHELTHCERYGPSCCHCTASTKCICLVDFQRVCKPPTARTWWIFIIKPKSITMLSGLASSQGWPGATTGPDGCILSPGCTQYGQVIESVLQCGTSCSA